LRSGLTGLRIKRRPFQIEGPTNKKAPYVKHLFCLLGSMLVSIPLSGVYLFVYTVCLYKKTLLAK